MKDKKKKQELTNEEIDENIFEMCNICSTTDCTGLIQVVPRTEADLESYEKLYPFRPPFLLHLPVLADNLQQMAYVLTEQIPLILPVHNGKCYR